ncbi:MAG: methyltransferase [Parcubacteria group bacterium Licking1014_17]|nr:MAG: methyltransferase [Parcubacteria group bacterium Licking1014_17]
MEVNDFERKKSAIIAKYNGWSSYDLNYNGGEFFMSSVETKEVTSFDGIFLKNILDAVANFTAGKKWEELEILDLGSYEGQVGIEFARQNAKRVVCIEGREGNVVKANFAKEVLNLKNLELFQDDVMNLSVGKYGSFDVVLCLGILYHLPVTDVFRFMKNVYETAKDIAIVDTHFAMADEMQVEHKGNIYHGRLFDETPDSHSPQSSLAGGDSFWLNRASLLNLIRDTGFDSLYVVPYPGKTWRGADDRITVVAVKHGGGGKKMVAPVFYRKENDRFIEKEPSLMVVHKKNMGRNWQKQKPDDFL